MTRHRHDARNRSGVPPVGAAGRLAGTGELVTSTRGPAGDDSHAAAGFLEGLPAALIQLIAHAASLAPGVGPPLSTGAASPLPPLQFGSFDILRSELGRALEQRLRVEGFSRKTVSGMRTATNSFCAYVATVGAGETFVRGDIRQQRQLVADWTAAVRTRTSSHDTVSAYWRGLKSTFVALCETHACFNPFTGLRAPRPGQRRVRAITGDALHLVYEALLNRQCRTELERLRDLAVFALASMAGLRHGEIRRLKVSEINLETGRIAVTKGKGRYGGKDRVAQLIADALPIVRAYAEERSRADRTHSEFITSATRDRPPSEKSILAIFGRIQAATGTYVRPHMCRHTFNVILERAGVRDAVRMKLLGHTKLEALQYYTHAFDGEAEAAARSIRIGLDTSSLQRSTKAHASGSAEEGEPRRGAGEVLVPDPRVAHGRDDARVPGEGLDVLDGRAVPQELGDVRVAEGVHRERDSRRAPDGAHHPDEGRL